jgi:hypothetical protein
MDIVKYVMERIKEDEKKKSEGRQQTESNK